MGMREDVAKLYVATFNRAPDTAGLDYWVNSSGLSLEGIAASFFEQPETQALYSDGSDHLNFVNSVYANLFNRTPDTGGLDYWVNELATGSINRQKFILAVINGAQDTAAGLDATTLTNKMNTGLAYTDLNLNDIQLAKTTMELITGDTATVQLATDLMNTVVMPIGNLTQDMVSGTTLYKLNTDGASFFEQAILDKLMLQSSGDLNLEEYTATVGSSMWQHTEDFSSPWSIENGKLLTNESTLTLISDTPETMTFYESGFDDTEGSWGEYVTFYKAMPAVPTAAMLLADGYQVLPLEGRLSFVASVNGQTVQQAVPADAKVRISINSDYDNAVNMGVNADGSFAATAYADAMTATYSSSTSPVQFGVYHDLNNNSRWDEEESSYSYQEISLTEIAQNIHTVNILI